MQTMPNSALHEDEVLTRGVLSRRFIAWLIDLLLIGVLVAVVWTVTAAFGLVTLGLGWYLLPWVSVVPFAYHWLSIASPLSATPGQAVMGLALRNNQTLERPDFVEAAVWVILYYLTLAVFCPALLIMLFTERKRALHDIVSGLVMVRRRALTPPAGYWNMADNR
jgi:uncharacterized RDD family membrane protein YckC